MRRLYRILNMPTKDIHEIDKTNPDINCLVCQQEIHASKEIKQARFCIRGNAKEECCCKGFFSLLHKSVSYSSDKYRDILIKISLMC